MNSLHFNSYVAIVPFIVDATDAEEKPPGTDVFIEPSKRAYLHGQPVGQLRHAFKAGSTFLGVLPPADMQPRLAAIETMGVTVKLMAVVISGALHTPNELILVTAGADKSIRRPL